MTFINQSCLLSLTIFHFLFKTKLQNDMISIILSTMTVQEMAPRDPIYPENHIFIFSGSFRAQLSLSYMCIHCPTRSGAQVV
jgi:hypothetical protein